MSTPDDDFQPIEPDPEPFEPLEAEPDPHDDELPRDEAGDGGYGETPDMTAEA